MITLTILLTNWNTSKEFQHQSHQQVEDTLRVVPSPHPKELHAAMTARLTAQYQWQSM
jgi:hypothetical protein